MNDATPFIDYYDVLQVDPDCDAKTLESAYHYLAKMYHPDHSATSDTTKFNEVVEAYKILRNAELRAEYDLRYAEANKRERFAFHSLNDGEIDEKDALNDAEVHARILTSLYKRRREHAQNAGVAGFYIQEMLNCSDEHFEFHVWYLKAKGFIVINEQGALAITIEGVDHVINMSRSTRAEKLLIAQSSERNGARSQAE
jgi:curved DNA-binding protein